MILPLVLPVALALAAPQKPIQIQKAVLLSIGRVRPATSRPGSTNSGERLPFDVVKLALSSDGTKLTFTATLKSPMSGDFASNVVEVYIDADNDPKTGSKTFWSNKPGFELLAKLYACIRYENGGSACAGGFTGAKVKGYYAVADLGRFKTDPVNPEKVVGSRDPLEVPFQGPILSASLSYKDLGVKPGQAIRIIARVSDGPSDETADFPEVLLTLK